MICIQYMKLGIIATVVEANSGTLDALTGNLSFALLVFIVVTCQILARISGCTCRCLFINILCKIFKVTDL